jgi:hypothetical protein
VVTDTDAPVARPDDLTAEWLTATLGAGRVGGFSVDRIGTGQMSECYRVALRYEEGTGPSAVVLKVAASDPISRQTGQALGLYEREVRFYAEVAPLLTRAGEGPIAHCYHASYRPETGVFTLLLDDAAPAEVGDEIRGADLADAVLALTQLGRLHAPVIGIENLSEAPWLNRPSPMNQAAITGLFNGFIDRYGSTITPQQRRLPGRRNGPRPHQGPGARRLPVGQHALRPARIAARSDRGRLADRHLGSRDD